MKLVLALLLTWPVLHVSGTGPFDTSRKIFRKRVMSVYDIPDFETYSPDLANREEFRHQFQGTFYGINHKNKILGYTYAGRVNSCQAGGCDLATSGPASFEYFDYFILFDTAYTVVNVTIYDYQATHGQEVCARSWLKQFTGYDGSYSLIPGKNIDAISGATKSVSSMTKEVEDVSKTLSLLMR